MFVILQWGDLITFTIFITLFFTFGQEDGYDLVNRYNMSESPLGPKLHSSKPGVQTVQSPRLLALITQLSALMLQIKRVADGER